jgi:Ran GTPase-activating protein (RanGAP) involved in mRNA processing and transport
MTAVVAPVMPVAVATSLGGREVLDAGVSTLNLQKLENPQASLHQCATKYGPDTLRSMFKKIQEKDIEPTFEEINLSDNLIGDEGAQWLKLGLSGNTSLKTLLLPRTGMTATGVKDIGTLMGELPNVETVVLSSSTVDSDGLTGEFCEGLSKNKSLKSLYLAVCRLGDKGIASLCAGPLKNHPTLEHISLNYNRLEVGAAKNLATMLGTNQKLRFLDLCGNSMGPEGAKVICQGLKANKGALQKLGFAQNAIKYEGGKALIEFFLSGKSLEFLDLRHNRIGFRDMMKLRELLEKDMDSKSDGWLYLFENCTRQLFVSGSN